MGVSTTPDEYETQKDENRPPESHRGVSLAFASLAFAFASLTFAFASQVNLNEKVTVTLICFCDEALCFSFRFCDEALCFSFRFCDEALCFSFIFCDEALCFSFRLRSCDLLKSLPGSFH